MSKDGVPPTPKTMAPPASGSGRLPAKRNPNPLIAAPSEDAINAAENSFIAERQFAADTHKLARLRVRKEGLELQDWFDERNEARLQKELEADRRQAEAEQKRIQQRQAAEAAQEQRRFCAKWLAYAIDQKPRNSPEDFALMIQQQVLSALAEIPSDQDD